MSATAAARDAIAAGLSVLPVEPGVKKPPFSWKSWQSEIMSLDDVESFFAGKEFGVICGKVSGNLECLDFDDPEAFKEWRELIKENGDYDVFLKCYIQKTPSGGWHVVYRAPKIEGNQKLAKEKDGLSARIETRGEGGYFKCYPSKGYEAKNNHLLSLPLLTEDEREAFHSAARFLNKGLIQKEYGLAHSSADPDSPGRDFEKRGDWSEILGPHGWTVAFKRGDVTYWRRPGKDDKGISATTGHNGLDFWCFSTSTIFNSERSYNKFAVYAFLNHGGNFTQAAKQLAIDGYGKQEKPQTVAPKPTAKTLPNLVSLANVNAGQPEFLWEPYIRRKAINLLDAKGGSGKTTLALMLGASGSIGRLPYGAETEPFDTLYFGGEDDPGELRTLFDRIGGDASRFHVVSQPFQLNAGGLQFVKDAIAQTNAKLVVFDALKYYLAGLVYNQLDDMQVAPHLANLKELAWDTGVAILNIRHFRKNADLTRLDEAGQGNEQWRNSHRSQLVMLRHPDEKGMSVCLHKKSNLLTPEGDAFAFQIKHGKYLWVPKDLIDLSFLDAKAQGSTKKDECVEWLRSFLTGKANGEYLSIIRSKAEDAGFKGPQLYHAKKMLEVRDEKAGGQVIWRIDPFED